MTKPLQSTLEGDQLDRKGILLATWLVSLVAGLFQILVHPSEGQEWVTPDGAMLVWFGCLIAFSVFGQFIPKLRW